MSAQFFELLDNLDACVFTGEALIVDEQRAALKDFVGRWTRALAAAEAPAVAQPHRTADQMRGFTELEDAAGGVFAAGALAAQPVQELADETGWLIEMRVNGHTLWWGGEFDNNEVAWSRCRPWSTDSHRLIARLVSDAYKAVRFARREDAQKALDGLLTARPCPLLQNAPEVYSVQEHMWPASKVEVQSEQPVPLTDEQRAEVLDALPKADERETVVCCITGSTLRALARAHGIGSKA